jgi:hypothetical protein
MTDEPAILQAVADAADTWAKTKGGRAIVAEDPQHAVDLMVAGQPGGLTVAVYWQGDAPAGEEAVPGDTRANGNIACAIWKGKGLKVRGEEAPALLDLCAGLRKAIVRMPKIAGVLDGPHYAGKAPVLGVDGRLMSGYVVKFRALYAWIA